jgi:DNA-binding NarL/FixJ family response regulator
MEKVKIMLVDDHRIFRDGIVALLETEDNIEILSQASDGEELLAKLKTIKPDIVVLDINMPKISGIEITGIMREEYPDIKVIILSANMDEETIFNSIKAGAKAFLPKHATSKELIDAIFAIEKGDEYISKSISDTIMKSYFRMAKGGEKTASKIDLLTDRELEIIKWFAEGMSYKEIGAKLFISARTVESHKNNIMEKLELETKVDLVKFAIKNKIIDL